MRGVAHAQVEIARRAAVVAGFALAGHADAAAIGCSRRDAHLIGIRALGCTALAGPAQLLLQEGRLLQAALYVVGSVALCLVGAWLGMVLMRAL